MTYADELARAMAILSEHPRTVFMGQGVACESTTLSPTFRDVPEWQLLEMPVAEDLQMGMAVGMALGGFLPVCVFPRWNFLLLAANQLVNHLDRLPIYSRGGYRPKVIIRTAVPSTVPFNPQAQHDDDFTVAFSTMLRTVRIKQLHSAELIVPAYREALEHGGSTLLVEFSAHYKTTTVSQQEHAHG